MLAFKEGLVSVSIVTFNSSDTLVECLNSLKNQTYEKIEVIVVDNASSDHSVSIARDMLPEATIIRNQTNVGFCMGQNIGISASSGEFAMPLNPDVQMSPTFIENLVRSMGHDKTIGIVVGKLFLPEADPETGFQLIDGAGLFINKARRQYLRGHGEPDRGQYDTAGYVFGACGAAPLYRRAMLEDIRLNGECFDNSFFAHKEDVDLSWRVQLLGWHVFYEPTAVAYHRRSFRPRGRERMLAEIKMHAVKNRYLTIIKNEHLSNFILHLPWIGVYDLMIFGYICLFERSSLAGVGGFLRLLPSALRKRRLIMKRKRVTASYIRGLIR